MTTSSIDNQRYRKSLYIVTVVAFYLSIGNNKSRFKYQTRAGTEFDVYLYIVALSTLKHSATVFKLY